MSPTQEVQVITIVIPVFNEAATITSDATQLLKELDSIFTHYECIFVDDGSTDKTSQLLQELAQINPQVTFITNPKHRGKGYALKTGTLRASGEIICFFDCDLAINPTHLHDAVIAIEDGADVAIASRYIQSQLPPPKSARRITSVGFTIIRKIVIGLMDISDTQCGCKAFKKKALIPIINRTIIDGFCFDAELLYILKKNNHSIIEIPVVVEKKSSRKSRVRVLPEIFAMTIDLLKIRQAHE